MNFNIAVAKAKGWQLPKSRKAKSKASSKQTLQTEVLQIDKKLKRLVHDVSIVHTTGVVQELPDVNSWDFIEAFYPNYYKCDDIMI